MSLASLGRRGGDFGNGADDMRLYHARNCQHLKAVPGKVISTSGDQEAMQWCKGCGAIQIGTKWFKPDISKYPGEL